MRNKLKMLREAKTISQEELGEGFRKPAEDVFLLNEEEKETKKRR